MSAKLIDRPLTFAVPQRMATALLPQQAALGTLARIKQTNTDYFNVSVQDATNPLGEIRFYTVRRASRFDEGTTEGYWIVERPRVDGAYEKAAQFKPSRLRHALAWAIRQVTADWIIEVRDGGIAR